MSWSLALAIFSTGALGLVAVILALAQMAGKIRSNGSKSPEKIEEPKK